MAQLNQIQYSVQQIIALFMANAWGFFLFAVYLVHCVCITMRWVQSYRIGKGHYLTGLIGCMLTWMYVPILFTAPTSTYWLVKMIWLPILGQTIINAYNVGFFYQWPIYDNWLDHRDDETSDQRASYQPHGRFWETKVGRFAMQPQPESTSFFMRHTKTLLAAFAFLLMTAFGFWRSTENLVAGATVSARTTKAVVNEAVNVAKKEITQTINTNADSVEVRQKKGLGNMDTLKQKVSGLERATETAKAEAKASKEEAKAAKNEVRRLRNSPVYIVQPQPTKGPTLYQNEQPQVPTKLRGRKTSMADSGESTYGQEVVASSKENEAGYENNQ